MAEVNTGGNKMFTIILSSAVMFVIFFCSDYFLGFVKDKEGNRSVKLSLLSAFIATAVAVIVLQIVIAL